MTKERLRVIGFPSPFSSVSFGVFVFVVLGVHALVRVSAQWR